MPKIARDEPANKRFIWLFGKDFYEEKFMGKFILVLKMFKKAFKKDFKNSKLKK